MAGLLDEHILNSLPNYFCKARGQLRHPYISPGAQYAVDLWDWDSYWFILAALAAAEKSGREDIMVQVAPYALGTLRNLIEHQGSDGCVPILICPDDDDPFDCRKHADNNMAKPFLGQLADLLFSHGILDEEELTAFLPKIQAFHDCLEARYRHGGTGLVCWGKDWGIGVDDDPTAWGRPPMSCANIFLNAFYLRDCQSMMNLCGKCGNRQMHDCYAKKVELLSAAIERYCWDEREKAYFSLDVQCRQNLTPHRKWTMLNLGLKPFWMGLKLKVLSWNCLLPFWCGLGTAEQFDAFVRENLTEERLWSAHGVRALSKDESMYAPEVPRGNPSNWLGPIWTVANYIVWETLKARGYSEKADVLAANIRAMLQADLEATGTLHEYYSPETGKGIMGEGFMSWNSLAILMK